MEIARSHLAARIADAKLPSAPNETRNCAGLGWQVNHERVWRIIRDNNPPCVRRRKLMLLTNSAHGLRVYSICCGPCCVTNVDQLWVADITYIRLARGVRVPRGRPRRLLAARYRVALDQTLDAELALSHY